MSGLPVYKIQIEAVFYHTCAASANRPGEHYPVDKTVQNSNYIEKNVEHLLFILALYLTRSESTVTRTSQRQQQSQDLRNRRIEQGVERGK